jgi:filamentous hemagglutinin family protein
MEVRLLSLALTSLAAIASADAAAAHQAAPSILAGAGEGAAPLGAVPPEPVPTDIQADTGQLGLGTQVTHSGNVHVIDAGTRAGANLFHSFSRFDLGQGDFARWVHSAGDPAGIRIIVNRVTGGDPSGIFGTIDSTALPNADFFFINPAGIVFGHGAQVNIAAAAHFSSAQELRFADGTAFTIAAPGGSTFSVAAPAAFGFVGSQGDIKVAGTGPLFTGATDVSLVAANIALRQAHIEAGSVQVAAVGGAAAIMPIGSLPLGPLAGRIDIGGGQAPSDIGRFDTAMVAKGARGVRLAAGILQADRASITAPRLAIAATEANLVRSVISSDQSATGEAGNISMGGRTLRLDSSQIKSNTTGPGPGGLIELAFSDIALSGSARITSIAGEECFEPPCGAQTGDAGNIVVRADRLTMIGDPDQESPAIRSDTHGTGAAGTITLHVSEIVLDAASISSGTTGSGAGGMIGISADTLALRNGRVSTNTEGPGAGGSISLAIRRSLSLDGARISSNSFLGDSGTGGTITIQAPQVRLTNASTLLTETFGRGDAGSIAIVGDDMAVSGASAISSSTRGRGAGGSLAIDVDRITISGSFVDASSGNTLDGGDAGKAGSITIRADDRLTLEAEEADGLTIHSLISSNTVTAADAGSITVDAGFLLMDNSMLSSETGSDGQAGTILVEAGGVHMRKAAAISTTSRIVPGCEGCDETPTGNGGLIRIAVDGSMTLESGSQVLSSTEALGDAGEIQIESAALLLRGGRISTSTGAGSSGRAGVISIAAPRVEILDAGSIESISRNANRAGGIIIAGEDVLLGGELSRISSSNEAPGDGDAGSLTISALNISLAQGARLTSSSASGAAGDVTLLLPEDGLLRLESTSSPSIISTSSGPGTGGRIIIANPRAIISNGGSILALGEEGGANVLIGARYFINSSDEINRVAVDGNFLLEAAAYDVSAGTVNRDLSVIDASGVLRGQCAAVRATGSLSQLIVRPIGPYGSRLQGARPEAGMLRGEESLRPGCS